MYSIDYMKSQAIESNSSFSIPSEPVTPSSSSNSAAPASRTSNELPIPDDGDERPVYQRQLDCKGHSGAVYTTKFSPNGKLMASGSFDRRILLWDATTQFSAKQRSCLNQHQQLVIDLAWSPDSASLISASYDHTVRHWDVETSQLLQTFELDGFVQTVAIDGQDPCIYYAGTSKKVIHLLDSRVSTEQKWENESMVNAVHVDPQGYLVLTGDARGMIKSWDRRKGQCIEELTNDASHHPISHLNSTEEGQFLAVNSYDNVLRVYDRDPKFSSSNMELVGFMTGHKNKNWPIKSAFFTGTGNTYVLQLPSPRFSTRKSTDGDMEEHFTTEKARDSSLDPILLATGSADSRIYLYDVQIGGQRLVQQIEGHSDRVYCVDFHPTEPILASASADCSVKIWTPLSYNP